MLKITLVLLQVIWCLATDGVKHEINNEDLQKEHKSLNTHIDAGNFENQNGYNKENENKRDTFSDSGKFGFDKLNENKHFDQSNAVSDNFQHDDGKLASNFNNRGAHKKGQHKKGFHNTYYKDEKGSNTSFYDDSDDDGDEYVHKSRNNEFDDSHSNTRQGSNLDGKLLTNGNSREGQYSTAQNYEHDLGDRRHFNKENYYDTQKDHRNLNRGNQYGYYDEKKYSGRPKYYENSPYYDYPNHYSPKKTITIYEDPRYFDEGIETLGRRPQIFRDDDYTVQLDIRPPFGPKDRQFYHSDRVRY